MKHIFLLFSAIVVALLAGIAVFLWSGRSPSNIAEKGRKIEQSVQQMQQQGREGVQQAKDLIKQIPIPNTQPNAQPPVPPKKTEEPAIATPQPTAPTAQTPRVAPKPPPKPTTPPGPPMEDVTHKDKEKLKDILGQ